MTTFYTIFPKKRTLKASLIWWVIMEQRLLKQGLHHCPFRVGRKSPSFKEMLTTAKIQLHIKPYSITRSKAAIRKYQLGSRTNIIESPFGFPGVHSLFIVLIIGTVQLGFNSSPIWVVFQSDITKILLSIASSSRNKAQVSQACSHYFKQKWDL